MGLGGRNSAVKKTSRGRPRLEDIRSMLREKLPELEVRYGVRSLGIFGSYARGEAKSRSDLDVLVEFARTPTLFEFTELEEYLTTLLDVKVELVSRKALRGARGERILEEVTHL
jgi:predicted nucleotidyltransferase